MTTPPAPQPWPSLYELVAGALRRPGLLALFALGGAGAGLLAGQMLPSRFEAVALVRMAQIGAREGGSKLVETTMDAVQRVGMPGFVQDAGLVPPGASASAVLPRLVPKRVSEQLVELRFRGDSPQAAEQALAGVFELLRKRQEELARPTLERMQQELRSIEALQATFRRQQDALVGIARAVPPGTPRTELSFLRDAVPFQDPAVHRWEAELRTLMAAPATLPTTLLEPIRAEPEPVSPRKGLLVFAGLLAGLAAGLAIGILLTLRDRAPRS